MEKSSPERTIAIVTAVMLGLVSVVTALGAWQAAVWNGIADEYAEDASDAQDVSINQGVLANYSLRLDQQTSAATAPYWFQLQSADEFETLYLEFAIRAQLARTTPGFADAWLEWADSDFVVEENPLVDPVYNAELRKSPDSYAYASSVLARAGEAQEARSGILAQAALIQALALFLFGISGVNRLRSVRIGVLALGVAVFLGGLALAVTAF